MAVESVNTPERAARVVNDGPTGESDSLGSSGLGLPNVAGMPPPLAADWPAFLAAVDATLPPKEVMQAALTFFKDECKFAEPQEAIGIAIADLRSMKGALAPICLCEKGREVFLAYAASRGPLSCLPVSWPLFEVAVLV